MRWQVSHGSGSTHESQYANVGEAVDQLRSLLPPSQITLATCQGSTVGPRTNCCRALSLCCMLLLLPRTLFLTYGVFLSTMYALASLAMGRSPNQLVLYDLDMP